MAKKSITLNESGLKELVKKILSEDIDMGQIRSVDDRRQDAINMDIRRNSGNGKEYQRRVRHLRQIMDEVEKEYGPDAAEGISLMIKKLNAQWREENQL